MSSTHPGGDNKRPSGDDFILHPKAQDDLPKSPPWASTAPTLTRSPLWLAQLDITENISGIPTDDYPAGLQLSDQGTTTGYQAFYEDAARPASTWDPPVWPTHSPQSLEQPGMPNKTPGMPTGREPEQTGPQLDNVTLDFSVSRLTSLPSEHKCEYCERKFARQCDLNQHRRIHEKPCGCPHCSARFAERKSLNRHIAAHHPEVGPTAIPTHSPPTPAQPERKEADKAKSKEPEQTTPQLEDPPIPGIPRPTLPAPMKHKCLHCEMHFTRQDDLENHLANAQGCIFTCPECPKQFSSPRYLQNHMRDVHPGANPYTCSKCKERFADREDLLQHYDESATCKYYLRPIYPKAELPAMTGSSSAFSGQLPPLDLSKIEYSPYIPNTINGILGSTSENEPRLFSQGLTGASVDWSLYDDSRRDTLYATIQRTRSRSVSSAYTIASRTSVRTPSEYAPALASDYPFPSPTHPPTRRSHSPIADDPPPAGVPSKKPLEVPSPSPSLFSGLAGSPISFHWPSDDDAPPHSPNFQTTTVDPTFLFTYSDHETPPLQNSIEEDDLLKNESKPQLRSDFTDNHMPDIFRFAHPQIYERENEEKYSPCHSGHRDISTLLRHLNQPAHRLTVTKESISSFEIEDNDYPHPRVCVCRRCWRQFPDRKMFEEHKSSICKKVKKSKREKWLILHDSFTPLGDPVTSEINQLPRNFVVSYGHEQDRPDGFGVFEQVSEFTGDLYNAGDSLASQTLESNPAQAALGASKAVGELERAVYRFHQEVDHTLSSAPTAPTTSSSLDRDLRQRFNRDPELFTDGYTINGASVDSGYVSALASASQKSVACPQHTTSESSTSVLECDAQTVYSDEGSINGAELDVYKSELVDNLVNQVRRLEAGPDTLERIFEALPVLMKSFALKLGQPGSTKAQRDVMYFVHKYRLDLSRRFKEAMLGLGEEDDVPPREPDPVDDEFTLSRIGEWLISLGAPTTEEPVQSRQIYPFVTNLPEDEEVILPDKHGYRQVVFDSAPYKALLSRLSREVLLTPLAEEDAMKVIRSRILELIPHRPHVSRHSESETFTMIFSAAWDPAAFLKDQYGNSYDPEDVLDKVITLTGSMTDAQALPCSEYLSQTWPMTGPHVLKVIAESIRTRKQAIKTLPDRSQITASSNDPLEFQLSAKGTSDFVAETGEIVAWLAAALRVSPDENTVAFCTPYVVSGDKIPASEVYRCELQFNISTDSETESHTGRCWKGMFLNPVIARGFPIPRRQRPNTGLEIPLEMAASLTNAKRLHEFMGRLCLKGFSAMLAPVEVVGGIVLWHLYFNTTGERISYLDMMKGRFSGIISANVLRSSRHVIGWCSDALYMFGDPTANYDIRNSNLPIPGKEFTLEKLSFSVGQIVNGGCQFAIGRKDKPVHITKQGYIAKLRWIEQRYVVMWDEEEKRGWLTKGTGALLHLLRASLDHSAKDRFSSEFLFNPKAFVEANRRFRNDSAIEVLLNPNNRKLRLYTLEEESFDDVVERPDGTEDILTKTRRTYTTVEHRVVELFESLEKLIDHEAQGEASAKGVNMKPRLRSYLQGWDFRDVATNRDPLYLRVATPPNSGRTWIDFAESARAVTLFGRGFGELISPASTSSVNRLLAWRTMPVGKGFLGACLADLRDMIENEGDKTTHPLTISRGILWYNPSQHNIFASNDSIASIGWNPVQELLPASPSLRSLLLRIGGSEKVDINYCQHGAVIFGRTKLSRFTWPDVEDPMVVAAGASYEALENPPIQAVEVSSNSSADSIQASTDWIMSENRDTQPTSPTLSQSQSQSDQFLARRSPTVGSGSGSQHGSVGSPSRTEAASFVNEAGLGLGSGKTARKRAAETLDGDELQRGITKRLKAVDLTAGFRGIWDNNTRARRKE